MTSKINTSTSTEFSKDKIVLILHLYFKGFYRYNYRLSKKLN